MKKGRIELIIGIPLLAIAILIAGYNIWLTKKAEEASRIAMENINKEIPEASGVPDYILNPNMQMPTKEIDGLRYVAILKIPSLNLDLPVLSEFNYDDLRKAPSRYTGSAYTSNLVICAHNYSSHFGRLKNIALAARVTVIDMDGNNFDYDVKEVINLDPRQVEEFTDSGYDLTLFTCTYTGNARVAVRCDLIDK